MISVIVPCYNQGDFLEDCLNSVENQTYKDWECIVVNDGSTDNTEDVAKKFCQNKSQYIYIEISENQGVSNARNTGIRASHGEYILPLDGDDKIAPTYMEKALQCFSEHPDYKLVYCICEKFGRKNGVYQLPQYDYNGLIWGNQIFCSAFYRRSDYDKTAGYNTNMKHGLEDWDFWLSFLNPEDKVYQIPEILFYYRTKTDSRGRGSVKHLNELMMQVYNNHKDIYAPYAERIIEYHHKLSRLDGLEEENENIKRSLAYRVGLVLTAPIRHIKKLLNQ